MTTKYGKGNQQLYVNSLVQKLLTDHSLFKFKYQLDIIKATSATSNNWNLPPLVSNINWRHSILVK